MDRSDQARPSLSKQRIALFGCLPLIAALGSAAALIQVRAEGALDRRSEELRAEVERERERRGMQRPVYFGEPQPGNAAEEYWLISKVLGPSEAETGLIPIETAPSSYVDQHAEKQGFDVQAASLDLMERIRQDDREPFEGEGARFLEAYAPLADQVRAGLRKQRCDWGPVLSQGINQTTLYGGPSLARLMAYQAFSEGGEAGVEKALEVVVLGHDIARHPSVIQASWGLSVESVGLETLEALLRSPLKKAALSRIIAVLGALPIIDIPAAFRAEYLAWLVDLSALADRSVGDASPRAVYADPEFRSAWQRWALQSSLGLDREWEALDDWSRRVSEALRLPRSQRGPAWKRLRDEKRGRWLATNGLFVTNVIRAANEAEENLARRRALRMLAAAKLFQLEQARAPQKSGDLTAILGKLPRDPCADARAPIKLKPLADGNFEVVWSQGAVSTIATREGEE